MIKNLKKALHKIYLIQNKLFPGIFKWEFKGIVISGVCKLLFQLILTTKMVNPFNYNSKGFVPDVDLLIIKFMSAWLCFKILRFFRLQSKIIALKRH